MEGSAVLHDDSEHSRAELWRRGSQYQDCPHYKEHINAIGLDRPPAWRELDSREGIVIQNKRQKRPGKFPPGPFLVDNFIRLRGACYQPLGGT